MDAPLPAAPGAAIVSRATPATGGALTVPVAAPAQARSDAHLLDLWLFGRRPHTRRAYRRVAGGFLAALGPGGVQAATLGDPQALAAALPGEESSRAVTLAAVKSLLIVGHRVGALPVDVGAALPVLPGWAERALPGWIAGGEPARSLQRALAVVPG